MYFVHGVNRTASILPIAHLRVAVYMDYGHASMPRHNLFSYVLQPCIFLARKYIFPHDVTHSFPFCPFIRRQRMRSLHQSFRLNHDSLQIYSQHHTLTADRHRISQRAVHSEL